MEKLVAIIKRSLTGDPKAEIEIQSVQRPVAGKCVIIYQTSRYFGTSGRTKPEMRVCCISFPGNDPEEGSVSWNYIL